MLKETSVRPIPKYMLDKIQRLDKHFYPEQKGLRMYSYLATMKKELVKITVAIRTYKKKWYCKQVAIHGATSDNCLVRDMEYNYYGYGYRIGWYAEGISGYRRFYEDGKWYSVNFKYFNPDSVLVNAKYVARFPEYRYSAYEHFKGKCIIEYLRQYNEYPQTEYLLKLGLEKLAFSKMILTQIAKDRNFCRWLIANKETLKEKHYYKNVILWAYKSGKQLSIVQHYHECKKRLRHDESLSSLKDFFKGQELERLFDYIGKQETDAFSYRDYFNACNYLELDMSVDKNRFPHEFKHWHDIRIDQYHTAKAVADEKNRAAFYKQFAEVADKYTALQKNKKDGYAVIIARSPAELMREGDMLNHCVGRMGYDSKMVREETLIFFVRDINKPDVPFVTVEYSPKLKSVLQCYGYGSLRPDDTVVRYVHKVWLPHANRTIKKITIASGNNSNGTTVLAAG